MFLFPLKTVIEQFVSAAVRKNDGERCHCECFIITASKAGFLPPIIVIVAAISKNAVHVLGIYMIIKMK